MFVVDTKIAKNGFQCFVIPKVGSCLEAQACEASIRQLDKKLWDFGATQKVVDDDGPDPHETMGPNGGSVDGWSVAESL